MGLSYPGVQIVLEELKVKKRKAMFKNLQLMELAALKVMNRGD